MIAIAESGSTKCDWVILNDDLDVVMTANTPGFNPYFHNIDFVVDSLKKSKELLSVAHEVTRIFFYGAGCSSPELNTIIRVALETYFSNATAEVDHDLVACAYSLYEGEPMINCIIGTGSNSCFFDGEKVEEAVPALGFILGDEGSGSYFGKKLLSDYFYMRLPSEIERGFEAQFDITWDDAVEHIYQNPHANVYLASFMRFIASYKDNAYVSEMVRDGMARFIDVHVCCFPNYDRFKVGFVGTVAYVFRDILTEELEKRGCKIGRILRHPIDHLVQYHRDYKGPAITA